MADFNFGQMRQDAMIVPTGDFILRCVKAEAVKNSKGDDMIKTQLEVIAGPHTGRKFSNNFNIIPSNSNALGMFFRQMDAFGLDEAYFNVLPNGAAGVTRITQDLVGRVVEANVGVRQWNGVDQPDIKTIKKAPAQFGGAAGATSGAQALGSPSTPLISSTPVNTVVEGAAAVNLPISAGPVSDPATVPSAIQPEEPAPPAF